MKTSELPVGAHVAYDRYQQRDHHNFVEAYVITHRPRGNKSSYWGSRTGNGDTVGIAYYDPYPSDKEYPLIHFVWVPPSSIHRTWAEQEAIYERANDARRQREVEKADRAARFAALPAAVQELVPDYYHDRIAERSVSVNISVDTLERLVQRLNATHPATVQAEVEAALALLQ